MLMSRIYINHKVSPRLYKTKNPPNLKVQGSYYENHIEDYLKELNRTSLTMLENTETLKENQYQQEVNNTNIHLRMDSLFDKLAGKLNTVATQIVALKDISTEHNTTYLENNDTQKSLLQSIDEKQQKMEQLQIKENNLSESFFKEIDRKIAGLALQVSEIMNLSNTQTDILLSNLKTQHILIQSIDEKQSKFEENQSEEIDLTQLLFQELNKKINEIPNQFTDLKDLGVKQTDTLLENQEVQQALLQSMEERQLKMEQMQREGLDLGQSLFEELNQINDSDFKGQRVSQNA